LGSIEAAGGKLILYHGWANAGGGGISPRKTVDYYETVERTMGGRAATQDFLRFFTMPGMGHCGGGAGANDFDYLSYLESWVEQGQAPEGLVGAHVEVDESRFLKAWNDKNADRDKIIAEWTAAMHDPANRTFTRPV